MAVQYQSTKTYRGGFYNSKQVNGINDRVYTAEDVRKPYDTVFSDGIKPIEDGTAGGTLKVTAAGGMAITVAAGHAKLGGVWFENTSPYKITLADAESATKYDCVIIRNDDGTATVDTVGGVDRETTIYVKRLDHVPTNADLTQVVGKTFEYCIAYVKVDAFAAEITASDIIDTRTVDGLCQVMTGVGAVITRTQRGTYFTDKADQTIIPIEVAQFDKKIDKLTVIVEGNVFAPNRYSIISNEEIEMLVPIPVVGTRIDFEATRNVNGAASADATGEYKEIVDDVAAHNKNFEHHYYCNGATDNIEISKICSAYLGGDGRGSMRLVVHGHFGASAPQTGDGTSDNPYVWIRAGAGGETSRRVFLDFTDCGHISIQCDDGTYNCIFFGYHCDVIGANVVASGGEQITMFSRVAKTVSNATDCRLWITSKDGYIARGGTFRDCRVSVTTTGTNACAFNTLKGGLLRLFGGEYYAYAPTGYWSAVVYVQASQTDATSGAVVNTYSINCPTTARSGYVQTYAVNCATQDARCSFTDTITTLTVAADKQNIRGTIAANIAGTL